MLSKFLQVFAYTTGVAVDTVGTAERMKYDLVLMVTFIF